MPPAQSFLYLEVVEQLRRQIASGQYPVGSTIPSMTTLMKEFNVSQITIRRALQTLTFEGLLYGRQGLGVFVADRRQIVRVLTSSVGWPLGNDIRRAGYTPRIEEISYVLVKPPADSARPLKLPNKSVYRHEKRIFADDAPIALDVVYLPPATAKLMREDLKDKFVFALIKHLNIPVHQVDFEISSTFATDHEVSFLNVAPRSPLVVANYVLYDKEAKPLLQGYTAARAERMTFAISSRIP